MSFKRFLATIAGKLQVNQHTTRLRPGDNAPPIEGLTEKGIPFDADSVRGKKLILYFYPKDDTAGCTTQACSLRDNHAAMMKQGFTIIGVSPDSVEKHREFMEKYKLPFTL